MYSLITVVKTLISTPYTNREKTTYHTEVEKMPTKEWLPAATNETGGGLYCHSSLSVSLYVNISDFKQDISKSYRCI